MDLAKFFSAVRGSPMPPHLTARQVSAIEALLRAMSGLPIQFVAYLLATAFHETGGAMVPNVENLNYTSTGRIRAVWPSRFPTEASAAPFVRNPRALANKVYNGRLGNREGTDDGFNYRGRGQVHATGRDNYAKVKAATGVDVVTDPDKMLDDDVSATALVEGCLGGWYTGKKLGDYLPADYAGARRVVNGTDQAEKIANYARKFEIALRTAGYSQHDPKPAPTPRPPPPQKEEPQSMTLWGLVLKLFGIGQK